MIRTVMLAAAGAAVAVTALPRPDSPISADAITAHATRWLESLDEDQRRAATFAFDDEERTTWHFIPGDYAGLGLYEMNTAQRTLAHDLLRAATSSTGYLKATTIMMLERVLRDMAERRGGEAAHRDPERYWLAVFGAPGEAPWGWRLQGHHLSLNFSLAGDEVTAFSPAFMGASPAEVREGPHAGLRPLAAEEDLARALLNSLDEEQLAAAMIEPTAPRDVILGPGREATLLGEPRGLQSSAMTRKQRTALMSVVREYAHNLRRETARDELGKIRKAGTGNLYFAWAGSTRRGEPHYYRIHGPTFVVELDNTQNDANHVHTVWHDLTNDFAVDWLREHYKEHR